MADAYTILSIVSVSPSPSEPFRAHTHPKAGDQYQLSEDIKGYGSNISTKNCCLNNMGGMPDACHNDLCFITVI